MDTRNLDKTTKLLYSIRRFGEISLYDLFREFVSAENGKEFSDALYFSEDILSLIKKNYVKMYSTDLHRAKLPFEYEDVSDLSWAEDMVRRTVWKILHPNSVKDKEEIDPKKVFLATTQEFDSLQQKIGFSITRQAKWIWREENCEELFGSVKREKNDCVFVVMPFEGNINPVFNDHIAVVCNQLGISCCRADLIDQPNVIINDIWSQINNTDVVVCDCTGRNANVFYELGLAHALGKKVICLTQNEKDIPFDIEHIRYIKYENTDMGLRELERILAKYIKQCL